MLTGWNTACRLSSRGLSFDREQTATILANILIKLGLLNNDLDYHFYRIAMVIRFIFFGYQK